jgi:hypothetical protein
VQSSDHSDKNLTGEEFVAAALKVEPKGRSGKHRKTEDSEHDRPS